MFSFALRTIHEALKFIFLFFFLYYFFYYYYFFT